MNNAIPAEKMGLVTPRAFSRYDPSKVPQTKYFQDVLENSLTENEIGLFCEDFLRLLNFNQKKHKERVPCLVSEPASRKTSLFYPILELIHHSNVATVTKQKVFNKAMIGKNTEVIFIDEATPSTLDVDNWKILTEGGYSLRCQVQNGQLIFQSMSHVHDCTPKTSIQGGRSAGYGPKAKVLLLQKPVKSEKEGRPVAAQASYGMCCVGYIESEGRYR